ncbi:hypothetical protein [uncultured Muribaculum sp.]|uniref:hypothetical protein n=1 Tax=uncultured Muribaculum sp. TaxID=1918613 RepID=UPI00267057FE|nr:hypothetical protein [uncultured Muribaculum sp.]
MAWRIVWSVICSPVSSTAAMAAIALSMFMSTGIPGERSVIVFHGVTRSNRILPWEYRMFLA